MLFGFALATVLSEKQVCHRLGVSRSTIRRWEKESRFPARTKMGPHRVGWPEYKVEEWLASCPTAKDDPAVASVRSPNPDPANC